MKTYVSKIVSFLLSLIMSFSIMAISSPATTPDGKETGEASYDPVAMFDKYSSQYSDDSQAYVDGRILLIINSEDETIKSTVFSEIYSEDYVELNEERFQLINDNSNESGRLSDSNTYADSIDEAKRIIGTTVRFKKMEMLNPQYDSKTDGYYSIKDGQNDIFLLELEDDVNIREALVELNKNPKIAVAEPDYIYHLDMTPDDEYYNNQWGIRYSTIHGAWNRTTGSSNVVVGVIDSGIDGTHPDLVNNLWNNPNPNQNGFINDVHGYDFVNNEGGIPYDTHYHGTHVAGIIGAEGYNEIGISGVNWDVSLAWLGICDGEAVFLDSVVKALNYCNNHQIKITNNSYGGSFYSETLRHAIANYNGIYVTCSGNCKPGRNIDDPQNHDYPSCYDLPNIISVGALGTDHQIACFSNYGPNSVDVFAPGEKIFSTVPGGYDYLDGTSMACPFVTGVIALVMATKPSYTLEEVKYALLDTVIPDKALAGKCKFGGYIDAECAVYYNPSNLKKVTFDTNNGTPSNFVHKVLSGEKVSVPDFPSRANYFFDGWYQTGSTSVFDFDTAITSNITLVAEWKPETNNIFGTLFPDYSFRQYVLSLLNTNDNGSRTSTSAVTNTDLAYLSSQTELIISNLGIEDLTGIEYFNSIEELDCSRNKIKVLPSSLPSSLKEIDCSCNNLTTLCVSSSILETLNCSINCLTSLYITNCTSLLNIDCSDNFLPGITISGTSSIRVLNAAWNMLTSFDFSQFPNIEDLNLTGNCIGSFSITGNTSLKNLTCLANGMTVLAVQNHPAIRTIQCGHNLLQTLTITNNDHLESIDCSFNNLDRMTITNNDCLHVIDCSNNIISNLSLSTITNNLYLEEFNCSFNNISTFYCPSLTSVQRLICVGNNMQSFVATGLSHLKALFCSQNSITSLNVSSISSLRVLKCENNLINSLILNTGINELYCEDCQLTSLDLSTKAYLTSISCSGNYLTSLDLSNNNRLRNLDCKNNQIESLILPDTISSLNCSQNSLKKLNLQGLSQLSFLYCNDNNLVLLNTDGCSNLSYVEADNNGLREFDLGDCPILEDLSITYNELFDLTGFPSNYVITPQITWNNPFTDVTQNTELYYNVKHVYEKELMLGTSPTVFSPNNSVTRSQIAVILYRREGSPSVSDINIPFTDVPNNNSESTKAIKWAYSNGIVNGTSSTTFSPNISIKRQDLAVVIGRYIDNVLQISLPTYQEFSILNTYTDYSQISQYARTYVKRLYEAKILCGSGSGQFSPMSDSSRSVVASTQYRIFVVED